MKYFFTLLSILFLFSFSFAQDSFSLRGKVLTPKNNKGVEGATVLIISSDSSLRKGAFTESSGKFLIEGLRKGDYFLTITLVG